MDAEQDIDFPSLSSIGSEAKLTHPTDSQTQVVGKGSDKPNEQIGQEEPNLIPMGSSEPQFVNINLLESIKNFMDDLSNVTTNQNFVEYHTIVDRIDEFKVKSYLKLVDGFRVFFKSNCEALRVGNFEGLADPNISFKTNNGSFAFDFEKTFQEAEEKDQDIIKDHLNHIWGILDDENKGPEELYIDKIFRDLKAKFSPDLTREEQMTIAKDLFSDFQRQNLDISIVVKVACKKAREVLVSQTKPRVWSDNLGNAQIGSNEEPDPAGDQSKTLVLIDAVEEIDVNDFNMVQFMGLVGKVGALFSGGGNPLNGLLSSVFACNNQPLDFEKLNLGEPNQDRIG